MNCCNYCFFSRFRFRWKGIRESRINIKSFGIQICFLQAMSNSSIKENILEQFYNSYHCTRL